MPESRVETRHTSLASIGVAQEVLDDDAPEPSSTFQLDFSRWLRDMIWYPRTVDTPQSQEDDSPKDTIKYLRSNLNSERQKHDVPPFLYKGFLRAWKDVDPETDLDGWLRLATWWLLKSRVAYDALASIDTESIDNDAVVHQAPWLSNITITQAYIDILKSSFIVEEVILSDEKGNERLDDTEWIILKNLSDSVDRDLAARRAKRTMPKLLEDMVPKHDLSFFETFMQPMEDPRRLPIALDNLHNPHRWLTPDVDHAGQDDEICLFRTFVNAQIGPRGARMKSLNGPYLLVVFCKEGRSELIVSLFNQHKTINLSRYMTIEDFKIQREDTQPWEGFRIDFPSQDSVIQFLCVHDKKKFIDYHKTYFSEMEERMPRPGEFLSFRDGLNSYELRDPSVKPSASFPAHKTQTSISCEISLYEHIPDETWKTTRRIVISSSPATNKRWCTSHWLPLDKVQIQENGRQIRLIWSDCDHLDRKSDGFYVRRYSYIYRPDKPNRVLDLEFSNNDAADGFVNCILHPFETPFQTPYVKSLAQFISESNTQEAQVYELSDMNEAGSQGYNALVSVSRNPNSNYSSEVFFVYRDLDFQLESALTGAVIFPNLRTQTYISNKTDMNTEPAEDSDPPELEGIKVILRPSRFAFNNLIERVNFMELLLGWKLIYSRLLPIIRSKKPHALTSKTMEKVTVSLWKQSNESTPDRHALTFRLSEVEGPRWITAALDGSQEFKEDFKNQGLRVGKLSMKQGMEIDSKSMQATGRVGSRPVEVKGKKLVWLTFESKADLGAFVNEIKPIFEDWPSTTINGLF